MYMAEEFWIWVSCCVWKFWNQKLCFSCWSLLIFHLSSFALRGKSPPNEICLCLDNWPANLATIRNKKCVCVCVYTSKNIDIASYKEAFPSFRCQQITFVGESNMNVLCSIVKCLSKQMADDDSEEAFDCNCRVLYSTECNMNCNFVCYFIRGCALCIYRRLFNVILIISFIS